MSLNSAYLKIDLDRELDVGIQTEFVVTWYRFLKLKNRKCLGAILISELVLLILSLIVILPMALLLFRNISFKNSNDTTLFLGILAVAVVTWLGVNLYWFSKKKNVRSLAHLIESIEQHNRVIDSLTVLMSYQAQVNQQEIAPQNTQYETILEALSITRKSLINGLKLEAIVRKHSLFTSNRYQLLTDLEQDLTHLMSFDLYSGSGEYDELLNKILQIGIDINKEVRKMSSSFP